LNFSQLSQFTTYLSKNKLRHLFSLFAILLLLAVAGCGSDENEDANGADAGDTPAESAAPADTDAPDPTEEPEAVATEEPAAEEEVEATEESAEESEAEATEEPVEESESEAEATEEPVEESESEVEATEESSAESAEEPEAEATEEPETESNLPGNAGSGIITTNQPSPEAEPEAEATEEPAEEPEVEATEEAAEESEVEATEEAAEEPEVEATEEPAEESESTEEAAEEPEAEATEEPAEESGVEATEEAAEEPEIEATEEAAEEPEAEAAEESDEDGADEDGADEDGADESSIDDADVDFGVAARLTPDERNGMYTELPPMVINPSRFYYATLETAQGDIVVQLFADRAPITVNNFVYLAKDGYYDNTTFHRVLDGFMAQAGDPIGMGSGGPGYDFDDEIFPGLSFDRSGLLAMANRGVQAGRGTNGSQFFLTLGAAPWLDGNHTIFGEVVEGMEALTSITLRDPQTAATEGDEIVTITIEETDASILPEPTPPPPTPTPLPTPTPYAPSSMDSSTRPLAQMSQSDRADLFNIAPEMVIDTDKMYTAVFNTSKGAIRYELDAVSAPMAVNNLVVVAELGYYDNVPINQVNPGQFVITGAIVDETTEQPTAYDLGYDFAAETGTDIAPAAGVIAYIPVAQNDDGSIQSSGSQLLLALTGPPPQSAEQFSFFGQLIEGLEILEQLTAEDVITSVDIEME